jgi:hypothetical protein
MPSKPAYAVTVGVRLLIQVVLGKPLKCRLQNLRDSLIDIDDKLPPFHNCLLKKSIQFILPHSRTQQNNLACCYIGFGQVV